jgi:hypothetical protein
MRLTFDAIEMRYYPVWVATIATAHNVFHAETQLEEHGRIFLPPGTFLISFWVGRVCPRDTVYNVETI